MLLQRDMLTDTSLPLAAPGLQPGGIWTYLLQRKHRSNDSFATWNELKEGSTDPITTSLNLKILLATDDYFSHIWLKKKRETSWLKKQRETSLTKSLNYRNFSEILLFFSFVLSKRTKDSKLSGTYLRQLTLNRVPANVDGRATVVLAKFLFCSDRRWQSDQDREQRNCDSSVLTVRLYVYEGHSMA